MLRRPSQARDTQRGSISPIVWGVCFALAIVGIGGFTVGQIVATKQDVQRAADAAVLSASGIIRATGMPFTPTKRAQAQDLAGQNSKWPVTFTWQVNQTTTEVDFTVTATVTVAVNRLIYPSGKVTVSATAKGTVGQEEFSSATKQYPKLVMVLDYSGSMLDPMTVGNGAAAISVEVSGINGVLALQKQIRYGAVIFADSVFAQTGVPDVPNDGSVVRALVDNPNYTCPYQGYYNPCFTDSWDAINRGVQLLNAASGTENKFLLFVSDGQPNNTNNDVDQGMTLSRNAANNAWANNVTIFTLLVVDTPPGQSTTDTQNFMISISGAPSGHGDATYYRRADSAGALAAEFQSLTDLVACSIGPLSPAPTSDQANKMTVFLQDGSGNESPVGNAAQGSPAATSISDLDDTNYPYYAGNYFYYEAAEQMVYVTEPVCDTITNNHENLVVRYGAPAFLSEKHKKDRVTFREMYAGWFLKA